LGDLNREFVNARIDELELRRWWVAEQLDVSRRTLHRWLTGSTSSVPRAKLKLLGALLEVDIAQLMLDSPAVRATANDQVEAARTLLGSDLLDSMMPPHQFAIYEQLAKGLVVPGLTKSELGNLYMAICLAVFRQGKLEEAWRYARLAADIAHEIDDDVLRLRAHMQLSYREYIRGNAARALAMDEDNLALARKLGIRKHIAANLSNVADQYLDFDRYEESLDYQTQAIDLYEQENIPTSLVFCHLGLVMLFLETGEDGQAHRHLQEARRWTESSNFLRGRADCDQLEALLLARAGEHARSLLYIERAMDQYANLGIRETRIFANASRVYRLAGRPDDARAQLDQGMLLARERNSPMMEAQIRDAFTELSHPVT